MTGNDIDPVEIPAFGEIEVGSVTSLEKDRFIVPEAQKSVELLVGLKEDVQRAMSRTQGYKEEPRRVKDKARKDAANQFRQLPRTKVVWNLVADRIGIDFDNDESSNQAASLPEPNNPSLASNKELLSWTQQVLQRFHLRWPTVEQAKDWLDNRDKYTSGLASQYGQENAENIAQALTIASRKTLKNS